MNISSVISSTCNSSISCNGTEAEIDFEMPTVACFICILITLPTTSYVIWLIVTGTGNGLAAEFFVLNLSVCEIILCIENALIPFSKNIDSQYIGLGFLDGMYIIGYPMFECLVSVERYLAVVHPVIFLKYKPLRYRLICSAVAWVSAFVSGGVYVIMWLFYLDSSYIVCWICMLIFLAIQLFCCLAVLRALKQSGPGERGREREEENHMKRRAFNLILISTGTTVFIYATLSILMFSPTAENGRKITTGFSQICFTLAGLVQPVLFLYRVGKLNFSAC